MPPNQSFPLYLYQYKINHRKTPREKLEDLFWIFLGGVIGHFQTVTALLHRSQPVSTAKRLSEIAGEVAQIIGKILFDFHEYDLAWSYYAFSLSAAQAAGNADLWAVGLGCMSLLRIEKHQPQDALTLLVASQKLAVQQNGTRAWLACIEAEAHSQLEDLKALYVQRFIKEISTAFYIVEVN